MLNDVRYPALKVLDERRRSGERSWDPKNHSMKTSVQKRRKLVEYISKVALERSGSTGDDGVRQAIQHIEEEMRACFGQQWSINSLYLRINKYGYSKGS